MKTRLSFSVMYLLLFAGTFFSQSFKKEFAISQDIFGSRSFIQNKGQFNRAIKTEQRVIYGMENGFEKIYFTEKGLVYKLEKAEALTESDREAIEKGMHPKGGKTISYEVTMTWLNANQTISIEAEDKQAYYYTYGSKDFDAAVFKKLTYKNVYNHIDIEFTIPKDPKMSIKYTVILHPGAKASDLQLQYGGDIQKIKLNKNGDVLVKTPLDDIIEHAPLSFSEDIKNTIETRFELNNGTLSFSFPKGYNVNKTLIIDPYVSFTTTLTTNSYAYDVDYDYYSNTYVYGGYSPYKEAKYNSSGALVWVFGGLIASTTPTWSSAPILTQASNFAVNRYNRKSYIGQGYVGTGNRVVRIDASGNYDNFINAPSNQFQEVWDMGFHCTTGNVFVLGGGTSTNNSACTLDSVSAAITLSTFQPTVGGSAQDVASHAIDELGNIFVIYAGNLGNKICRVNNTFNGNVWTQPSNYTSFTEQGNKTQYQGTPALSSNGFNILAVNANYLFYYNGHDLSAYDKTTGAQIASTTTTLTLKRQGGIAVDDCNNIYLGGNGLILCYNFTGTSFNSLNSIPLTVTTLSNQYVYDIKLDKQNKVLYVCGSGFVANYSAINSLACITATSACFGVSSSAPATCFGSNALITVFNGSGLLNPTYSIQPSGATNTTGSFVITPTASAVYTTYVTGMSQGSVVITQTALANVNVFAAPLAIPSTTQSTCNSATNAINLAVSFTPVPSGTNIPNYTINWMPTPSGITNNTQTATSGGIVAGIYNATVTASNGCMAYVSYTINAAPAPADFTISPPGGYLVNCYNPILNVNYLPSTHNYTTFNGFSSLQIGPSTTFSAANASGIYTVNAVNPTSGCIASHTFAVSSNTVKPLATVSPTFQSITCGVVSPNNITITATNPTVNVSHIILSPIGGSLLTTGYTTTYPPGIPGAHTVITVNDANGCTTVNTFSISSNTGFPTFSVVSQQNFTLGCSSKSMAVVNIINGQSTNSLQIPIGGAVSYTMLNPGSSSVTPGGTLSLISNYSITTPGTYTIVTKDNVSLCETRLPISIISNTAGPKLDTILYDRDILNCSTPTVTLKALSSNTNTGFVWSYDGAIGNLSASSITISANFTVAPTNTIVDQYTLTLTDAINLCKTSSVVVIYQNLFPPKAVITNGGISGLTCKTTSVMLTNSSESTIPLNSPKFPSGAPVVGYIWKGPSPQTDAQGVSTYVGYIAGTYTMIAKDLGNGCTTQTVINIADNSDYPVVNNPIAAPITTLDCGKGGVLKPIYSGSKSVLTYSWMAPGDFPTSPKDRDTLFTDNPGLYVLLVTNTVSGCSIIADMEAVTTNTIFTDFTPNLESGFVPLPVYFTNNSRSASGSNSITSVWNFGNGTSQTYSSVATASTVFNQPGTYTVTLFTAKGNCMGTSKKIIQVDIPSDLNIPNIFSPNGDGVNDFFFLKATNLIEIKAVIYDRWGHKVFDLTSTVGNISWDGKNPSGKDVAEGVYFYVINASGKDGKTFEFKGNVTIVR